MEDQRSSIAVYLRPCLPYHMNQLREVSQWLAPPPKTIIIHLEAVIEILRRSKKRARQQCAHKQHWFCCKIGQAIDDSKALEMFVLQREHANSELIQHVRFYLAELEEVLSAAEEVE